jgi:hypothetical protein
MPDAFLDIAVRAAAEAAFANYDPDACLINHYIAGAKLSLHQDRDEKDAPRSSPSHSVCLLYSCGAANVAPIGCAAFASRAATSRCGAVPHASSITVSHRSTLGSIR